MYDCTEDVKKHVVQVQRFVLEVINNLVRRSDVHDSSKLEEPEKSMYDEFTPLLRDLTYGSPEYKETLSKMGAALEHHYSMNSHHPEFWERGIKGMSLLDLIEMCADWKAATMRHANGNLQDSLHINKERYHIDDQLFNIIVNTIKEMDW